MINDELSLKPKVMLLTRQLDKKSTGSRELLCRLNYDALKEIYSEKIGTVWIVSSTYAWNRHSPRRV